MRRRSSAMGEDLFDLRPGGRMPPSREIGFPEIVQKSRNRFSRNRAKVAKSVFPKSCRSRNRSFRNLDNGNRSSRNPAYVSKSVLPNSTNKSRNRFSRNPAKVAKSVFPKSCTGYGFPVHLDDGFPEVECLTEVGSAKQKKCFCIPPRGVRWATEDRADDLPARAGRKEN
jgi:hypothetical protein